MWAHLWGLLWYDIVYLETLCQWSHHQSPFNACFSELCHNKTSELLGPRSWKHRTMPSVFLARNTLEWNCKIVAPLTKGPGSSRCERRILSWGYSWGHHHQWRQLETPSIWALIICYIQHLWVFWIRSWAHGNSFVPPGQNSSRLRVPCGVGSFSSRPFCWE